MFEKIDTESINTVRVLAADVVRKANSGHPGAPMGCKGNLNQKVLQWPTSCFQSLSKPALQIQNGLIVIDLCYQMVMDAFSNTSFGICSDSTFPLKI
jgi:Transketolase, thiamine diphosphate binding domain